MTIQNLLNLTAPEYEIVKIYDVIQNLSIETNETFSLWLLRIARSACPLGESLSNCDIVPLTLRPDEKWGIPKTRRETTYRQSRPSWFDGSAPMERAGSHLINYHENWNFKESVLSWVCTEYAYPPSDDRVFKGIDINFINEGIVLYRSDFREWCLASNYPLPRFWFAGQTENPEKTKGQALADLRHGKAAPSKIAVKTIADIIEEKNITGDYWHQITEIRSWLSDNPNTRTTEDRLKTEVNKELCSREIAPKRNAPRKNK
ncbi:MAG: hypothetical protein JRG71_05605 [Deltaproteobacteria bacterium]|nr:hypothetical protein [Deltaproteobacteria bacterium]